MSRHVTRYIPEKSFNGYTLFCHSINCQEGHDRPTGFIYLIDMGGEIVHQWATATAQQSFASLLPDGNLLYPTRDRTHIAEAGLRELTPEGEITWHYHCRIDHDYQVLENGRFLIHTIHDTMDPALGPGLKRHPCLIEINREGQISWEWHGERHVTELETLLPPDGWKHFKERVAGPFAFDWAHNNTCQIIPPNATFQQEQREGGPPRFRPGNIVFSYRSLDIIGVIDRETGNIVWAWGPGELDGQHKPHILENGNLLIFDNGTLRKYSRVIEMNPLTEEIVWEYRADPKENFFSPYISGAQRLPNGNTLICEGQKSHLFEVTPDKEIVWDFVSTLHEETPAMSRTIYRCLRYSPEYVRPLLARIG